MYFLWTVYYWNFPCVNIFLPFSDFECIGFRNWRGNKKIKRPWTFSCAPVPMNLKHEFILSWCGITNWMEGHWKPFLPYWLSRRISSVLSNLMAFELCVWGSWEWVRVSMTSKKSRENPNCGQKYIAGSCFSLRSSLWRPLVHFI